MKNIILQHWTGELNELCHASVKNISKYAGKVGAEYRLLRGNVFRENLSPPCQKLYMLDEEFDDYDVVVMLDPDMFTRKGMEDDIFDEDIDGIGMSTDFQERLFLGIQRRHPKLTNSNHTFWGGAIWKLSKDIRQKLRMHINEREMAIFSNSCVDEGIMHRLATLAHLEKQKLPGDRKWCHGSYEAGIEHSALIHIRTKIAATGPKRDKIVNYKELVKKGLIAE